MLKSLLERIFKNRDGEVSAAVLVPVLVVLMAVAGLLGYFYGQKKTPAQTTNTVSTTTKEGDIEPSAPNATNTPTSTVSVKWQQPQKIAGLKLFTTTPDEKYLTNEAAVTYYKVGEATSEKGKADVVYADGGEMTMEGPTQFLFLKYPTTTLLLARYTWVSEPKESVAQMPISYEGLDRKKFAFDHDTVISELEFPTTLQGPKPRQVLTFVSRAEMYKGGNSLDAVAFTDPVWGLVKMPSNSGVFYVSRGTLSTGLYTYKPDFYNDGFTPQITFNDGTKNNAEYAYAQVTGCGSREYLDVIDQNEVSIARDLAQVGTNNRGDAMYELKDTNHKLLKELYTMYPTDPALTYDEFIASRPLLFWVDPFGRLIRMQNTKFAPQAECGKPVIYLYPEKTTQVSVALDPKGGFSYTEPEYGNGWNVTAQPNGVLHVNGTTYPYLFWEGRGEGYETPANGWVVKKAEVESFLNTKLKELGLNKQETADFMEFWLPRMQAKPYYFITFMGNSTMDKLAPLTVTPKPDTVIRVLMDFKPLDAPIAVKPLNIRTPERDGFTVVEWGGVLRK